MPQTHDQPSTSTGAAARGSVQRLGSAVPDWLDNLDAKWNGKVIPFVLGLNVGALLTVIIFIASCILCGGK